MATVVGTLLLGFFAFISWKGKNAAEAEYKARSQTVKRLEAKKIFPNAKNLEAKTAEVEALSKSVDALQKSALKIQKPLSDIDERQFRELLINESAAIETYAETKGISLPSGFNLGLSTYVKGKKYNPIAVPTLEWQMNGLKRFTELCAESGIKEIRSLERLEFPQEDTDYDPEAEAKKKEAEAKAKNKPQRNLSASARRRLKEKNEKNKNAKPEAGDPMTTSASVMSTYRFNTVVVGSDAAIRTLLNRLAAEDSYFMWLRYMRTENAIKESPQVGALPRPEPVEGAGQDVKRDVNVLFGNEDIYALLAIDLVRFKDPAADDQENEAEDSDEEAG